MSGRIPGAAACVAALAFATSAFAQIDVFVGPNAGVRATIEPGEAPHAYRFLAPAGSRVDLLVQASGRSDVALDVRMATAAGFDVSLEGGASIRRTDRVVHARRVPLPAAGEYVVTVAGGGTGDYALWLRVRPRSRAEFRGRVDPGFSTTARRTLVVPGLPYSRLRILAGGDGRGSVPCISGTLSESCATGDVDTWTFLTEGMDVTLGVQNAGDVAGTIHVRVHVRAPRQVRWQWDLRARTLGASAGERAAVAQSWILSDTSPLDVTTGPLAGVSLRGSRNAAAGVLGSLGVLSAPAPRAEVLAGRRVVTPAVRFTAFAPRIPWPPFDRSHDPWPWISGPLSLPFDATAVPEGADPAAAITVLRIGVRGRVRELEPGDVEFDAATGRLVFPVGRDDALATFVGVVPESSSLAREE